VNVIFDIGGVIVTWNPQAICKNFDPDTTIQQTLLNKLLKHPDWQLYDKGELSLDDIIQKTIKRTGLDSGLVGRFMEYVPSTLLLKHRTVDLISLLKKTGNHLYCLSNMNFESLAFIEKEYDFWRFFEGKVISCNIKMVKPEKQIFKYILSTFSLTPSETVFIDDSQANIDVAQDFGIKTILFTSALKCKNELSLMGCL
jgi:putative hydrolase of the HAD superfamily